MTRGLPHNGECQSCRKSKLCCSCVGHIRCKLYDKNGRLKKLNPINRTEKSLMRIKIIEELDRVLYWRGMKLEEAGHDNNNYALFRIVNIKED